MYAGSQIILGAAGVREPELFGSGKAPVHHAAGGQSPYQGAGGGARRPDFRPA